MTATLVPLSWGDYETEHGWIHIDRRDERHVEGRWIQVEPEVWLSDFHVREEHRRQGHGRAIMAAVIEAADAEGVDLVLQVWADNTPALRLYESVGFEVTTIWESSVVTLIEPGVLERIPATGYTMRRPARQREETGQ
jgi:ribosomal protein S18 acetylase RimI-like enzyme